MALSLSGNHPIFQLEGQMQDICGSFLARHGFSYFQYLRCYADGSMAALLSYAGLFRHFLELDFPTLFSYYLKSVRDCRNAAILNGY
jgi:hypothetical protein